MFFSSISKYVSIYLLHIKRQFSYRFEFALWGILHPLRLVIMYYLWTSIFNYSGAAALGGLTVSEMIMYFVTSAVLDTYVNVDQRIGESINRGDIVIGFIRPITIFFEQLMIDLANRSNAIVFQMVPTAVFAFLFLGYHIISIPFALLGLTSALLALILNFEYAFIFGATTFWTKSYYGTRALKEGLMYLFGGWLIPITLYPLIFQQILYYTPLPYINFFPNMIFIGKYSITSALFIVMLQMLWIVILYGIYGILWHFAKKKFTGVGV